MPSHRTLRTIRPRLTLPTGRRGFALLAVLILLTALYLGATGIFLAARAELRIGVSHAASSQASSSSSETSAGSATMHASRRASVLPLAHSCSERA